MYVDELINLIKEQRSLMPSAEIVVDLDVDDVDFPFDVTSVEFDSFTGNLRIKVWAPGII